MSPPVLSTRGLLRRFNLVITFRFRVRLIRPGFITCYNIKDAIKDTVTRFVGNFLVSFYADAFLSFW
jgi:hypothetical protein